MISFFRHRKMLLMTVCGVLYYLLFFNIPTPEPLRVSPETTFFTEPVGPDGRIDFALALNRRNGPHPPVDNAIIPFLKIAGPRHLPVGSAATVLAELLGEPLPAPGSAGFLTLDEFLASNSHLTSIVQGTDSSEVGKSSPKKQTASRLDEQNKRLRDLGLKPWTQAEHPDFDAWLTANDRSLGLISDAAARPRCWWPNLPGAPFTDLGYNPLFRSPHILQAFRGTCARAMRKVGTGDPEGGLADLLDTLRASRHLLGADSTISMLIGLISFKQGLYGLESWINNASPSIALCENLINNLSALSPLPDYRNALEMEYRILPMAMVTHLSREGLGKKSPAGDSIRIEDYLDFNRLGLRFSQIGASFSTLLSEPDLLRRYQKIQELRKQQEIQTATVTQNNLIWRSLGILFLTTRWNKVSAISDLVVDVLVAVSLPNYLSIMQESDAVAVQFELMLLAARLKKHYVQTGAFPPGIDPALLGMTSVPPDPFSGANLNFRKENDGVVIYSIGPNGRDDGGKDGGENIVTQGDLAIRLRP